MTESRKTPKKAIIFGTGSFAQLVHFYLERDSPHDVVAFTVSGDSLKSTEFHGLPVVSFEEVEKRFSPEDHAMFIAVAYAKLNRVRERFFSEAKTKGYQLITYISSRATHWGDAVIGENVFVFEDNTIQPFITIGNGVVMWSGNHIGHHSIIGAHCFLTSHVVISGHVKVGVRCFFGVNSTVRDGISIGDDCMIGPGSLILKDTRAGEAYIAERTPKFVKDSDYFFRWK